LHVQQAMYAAIEFDEDAAFQIAKVENEITECDLASEMRTLLVERLEKRAKLLFRRRQRLAETLRSVIRARVIALAILILAPNLV